jgi:hypothetical protein
VIQQESGIMASETIAIRAPRDGFANAKPEPELTANSSRGGKTDTRPALADSAAQAITAMAGFPYFTFYPYGYLY